MGYGQLATQNTTKKLSKNVDDADEEDDLPSNTIHPKLVLSNTDYLKLYMQNNPIHDNDREKASSISNNLVNYDQKIVDKNPLFSK